MFITAVCLMFATFWLFVFAFSFSLLSSIAIFGRHCGKKSSSITKMPNYGQEMMGVTVFSYIEEESMD